jgi:K+-transporting ATPase ATPase C chain
MTSHLHRAHFAHRRDLPARHDGCRAASFPEAGERFAHHRQRQTGWLGFDRAEIRFAEILLAASVRRGLCGRVRREQQGANKRRSKKAVEEPREKFGANAPVDLLTASGTGLDPHISPEAARLQIPRVASACNMSIQKVSELVDQTIEQPQLGFLGKPRTSVLRLNRLLDQLQ